MGGVLERILGRPPHLRGLEEHFIPLHKSRLEVSILQLETAKEILREVFDASSSEVDEMIIHRLLE
jgi:hypothetical protein